MAGYVSFLYLRWHYPDQVPGQRLCLTLSRYDQLPYALSNVTSIEYDFYIHLSSFYNIKKSSFHCFYIIIWSQCQLHAQLASADDHLFKISGTFMDNDRIHFFHTERRGSSPDITGHFVNIFDVQHFHRLFTDRVCAFFQIQLFCNRQNINIISTAFPLCRKRFETAFRILS